MDQVRRGAGVGRLVLRGLAIASALGFLALVMVQAWAFYRPPPEGEAPLRRLRRPATKAAPVFRPAPLDESATEPPPPDERRLRMSGTKAGYLGPLRLSVPPRPPQPQDATPSRR